MAAIAAMSLGTLAACGSSTSGDDAKGKVYYLNFKPEAADQWTALAKEYTKEKGVEVKVQTAASGTYEQTLKSEIAKTDAPTLFQVNGPVGYQNWKKYTADMSNTDVYKELANQDVALKDGDKVVGVPYVMETYGLIYNKDILNKYFALDGAKAASMDEINNFAKLKEVTDDMQARKADLGIDGVFASTSLATGEAWRWQTHLFNTPLYHEYQEKGITDAEEIEFTYSNEFKNIFDLYLTNSTVEKTLAPSKTVTDSMAEFATGKAAMVQNGNWAWSQIKDIEGNAVAEEDIKFLPIYSGVEGEEDLGINVGTEAFMAVNSQATEADQQATIDFVNWLFTDEEGMNYVTEDLGFIAPFKSFGDRTPADPLAKEINRYISDDSLTAVPWVFTTMPSAKFKDDFAQLLAQYASGNLEWAEVEEAVVANRATEKAAVGGN